MNNRLEIARKRIEADDQLVFELLDAWGRDARTDLVQAEELHVFLEEATNRIRNSRSTLDRREAALKVIGFLEREATSLGMHERFLASIFGALTIYFQNRKHWDIAILSCEQLVSRAIADEEGQGYHVRLDWLYRQRARVLRGEAVEPSAWGDDEAIPGED